MIIHIGTESRVLKRTNDGDWELDGSHAASIDPNVYRNGLTGGISGSTTQFGVGLPHCIRFITHPVSLTECLDENISFSVTVDSREGAASYQWQKNGVDMPGETAATLSINNISHADAAIYRCEVTNACGTDYSDPADLFISEPFSGFGYAYRRTITINESQIPGSQNLENYPLMVNITEPELRHTTSSGNVENINGYDIAFVDEDGNKLDHQMESYIPTTGQYIGWVRIPSLSYNSNTDIYILYGNPQVSTDQSTERVWSSDYVAVWHLNDEFDDATFYGNDGTDFGTSDIAGLMGRARDFEYNDGDDRVTIDGFDVYSDEITLSSWINMESSTQDDARIISKANGTDTEDHWWKLGTISNNGGIRLRMRLTTDSGSDELRADGGDDLDTRTGQWVYAAAVYDGSFMRTYQDGSQTDTESHTGTISVDNSIDIGIGNQPGGGRTFDGILDEVRVMRKARSSDWLSSEYNNHSAPGSFYTVSAQSDHSEYQFSVCAGDTVTYNIPAGWFSNHSWTVNGGTVVSGSSTAEVEVLWDGAGPAYDIALEVDGTGSCVGSSGTYTVNVNSLPLPSIGDPGQVCPNELNVNYITALEAGHSYFWDVTGESGFTGQGTNSINVDWGVGPAGQVIVFDTINATGCSYSDTVTVSILDVTVPVITCPADVEQGVDVDQCYGTVTGIEPTLLTDDCPGIPTLTYKLTNATIGSGIGNANNVQFAVGITTVWYIAEDFSGNMDSCSFTVTINDDQAPVLTCKANQVRNTDAGQCTYTASGGEFDLDDASDNCDIVDTSYTLTGATTVGETSGRSLDGVIFNPGETTVTWRIFTAHDTNSCSFTINVTDIQLPTPVCKNLTVYLDSVTGLASITVDSIENGSFDNCAIADRWIGFSSDSSYDCGDIGTHNVYLVIEDNSGNIDSCLSLVTVEYLVVPDAFPEPVYDTICNGATTDILLRRNLSQTTFRWTVLAPPSISGASPDTAKFSIVQTLSNSSDNTQLVRYVINPFTYGCENETDTAYVSVDPTPMVVATPAKDTICTGDATSILLTTVTSSTNGVEFNYTSTASDGTIGRQWHRNPYPGSEHYRYINQQ